LYTEYKSIGVFLPDKMKIRRDIMYYRTTIKIVLVWLNEENKSARSWHLFRTGCSHHIGNVYVQQQRFK